jgi:hypothetical protein
MRVRNTREARSMAPSAKTVSGPIADALIEQLVGEGPIGMSVAAKVYGTHRGDQPTHPSTPLRHCLKGIKLPDGSSLQLE